MADERVSYEVAAKFTGEGELRRGAAEFDRLADKSKAALTTTTAQGPIAAAGNAWRGMAVGLGVAGAAYFAVSQAAERAYATLRAGAELQTTTERFGKLAAQINSTGDALLGKLREATKGMISDAELMASASGIVSLRLAENEDQVVRLATVVGTLGWDMQQVILTFVNLSTMRLDALGLSVDEVKAKQKELMAQGMSTAAAFKEAVIQAGEARLDVGGVSDAEASFKKAEAAVTNYKNAILGSVIATLDQAGAFDAMSSAAANMTGFVDFRAQIDAMRVSGALTEEQYERLAATMRFGGIEAANAQLQAIQAEQQHRTELEGLNAAVGDNGRAWRQWGIVAGHAPDLLIAGLDEARYLTGATSAAVAAGIDLMLAASADAEKQLSAGYMRQGRAQQQVMADMASGSNGLPWASDARLQEGYLSKAKMDYDRATEAARSYGGAMSYLSEEEQKAAEAHSRFLASFNEELRAKPEEGLYNAEGVANVEAVNKALYEQVEAAGASAATLALLGVATGQFTQEQAEAALKAAVLHEQIKAIAESVAAGDISIGDALGQLNQARAALDAANLAAVPGTGEGGVEIAVTANTDPAATALDQTATDLDALTAEEYTATVGMDIQAVIDGTTEAGRLINTLPDTRTVTIRWEQSGADVIAALRALGLIV